MLAADYSIEVVPPPASEKAPAAAFSDLSSLSPAFVAIAAYPGLLPSPSAVSLLRSHFVAPLVPHLTNRDVAKVALPSLLDRLQHSGVSHLIVVRGDASSDLPAPFDFPYAIDLVAEIRRLWRRGGPLRIEVGAHPEGHPEGRGPSRETDYLLRKLDAGGDGVITQFCYDADAVVRLRDRIAAKRAGVPLRAGVLLTTDLARISRLAVGAGVSVPPALRKALIADRDSGGRARTLAYLTTLVRELFDVGIPPHLFTTNDAEATREVLGGAGLLSRI
ncbi:MAG: methylenetetrahydrofolate reductase [Gammaproteobacteria bacterium]